MTGKARDMHVAELREVKAAAAAASRARKSRKEKQAHERKLAEKERDMQRRKRKAPRAPARPRALSAQASPAQGLSTPSAHKKWQKQLARAPGLLEKVREGRAALDALAAKVRKGLKVAD
jgi:hypothetical protein